MPDPRIDRLARTMVEYSTRIRPKEHVAIFASLPARPLAAELYRRVLRAGAYPYPLLGYEEFVALGGFDELFFTEANEDQLAHVSRVEDMVRSEFEVVLFVRSLENTRALSGTDPARQARRAKANAALFHTFLRRASVGEMRWCYALFPSEAHAQDAAMSLPEFEAFVYGADYADEDDPVARWRSIHAEQQRLVEWLEGRRRVELRGPNVDLSLAIEGRTFINSDGTFNLPDGEIYTGPVEDSAQGWVRFSYPVVLQGQEVEGVELTFERGRVERATAARNQDFLLATLDADAGARYLGEWAVGTNKRVDRFIKNILFDEKIGGTIHLALGAGYPETGSKNLSGIHWDMICDMRQDGQILVDGELTYDSGVFRI